MRRAPRLLLIALVAVAAVTAPAALGNHRIQRGDALYYANRYKGDRMACGPRYQPWEMVAAHRKLPCGKRVKVKNRRNGRVVRVTVQDRGPYGDPDAIIDVSRRAARKLGFLSAGRTKVKLIVLHD
jgi:rare lipoprotein A